MHESVTPQRRAECGPGTQQLRPQAHRYRYLGFPGFSTICITILLLSDSLRLCNSGSCALVSTCGAVAFAVCNYIIMHAWAACAPTPVQQLLDSEVSLHGYANTFSDSVPVFDDRNPTRASSSTPHKQMLASESLRAHTVCPSDWLHEAPKRPLRLPSLHASVAGDCRSRGQVHDSWWVRVPPTCMTGT